MILTSAVFASTVGVGPEMSDLQRQVLEPAQSANQWGESRDTDSRVKVDGVSEDTSSSSRRFWQRRPTLPVSVGEPRGLSEAVSFTGDWEIFDREGLRADFESRLVREGGDLGARTQLAQEYRQRMIEKGYLLADIKVTTKEGGRFDVHVDAGRFGALQIFRLIVQEDGSTYRDAYRGRFFSERQIQRMLSEFEYDTIFYYPEFYSRLYEINMHPDLSLNTRLRLRRDESRYADMDVTVEERFPLHAILDISNTGTESTQDWRAGLTIQHLNLTRREDVLTFRGINATDFSSMNSFALNYRLPYRWDKGGAVSVFGGYSRVDSDEIAPEIRIKGSGWFVGGMQSHRLSDTARSTVSLGAGLVYRVMEDQLVFAEVAGRKREAESLPLSLSLSYAAKQQDRFYGRNYLTVETAYNAGALVELSTDEAFGDLRQDATEAYWIQRVQIGRLQSLNISKEPTPRRDWSVFFKIEGQYADGALIPAEQFAIGGMNTVRGYTERTLLGDHGALATIELRSPIFQNLITRPWSRDGQGGRLDRLQALLFVDGGFIGRAEILQGEERTESISSAGIGLRWAWSRYAQLRADVAQRFDETFDQEEGVGFHVSAQLRY